LSKQARRRLVPIAHIAEFVGENNWTFVTEVYAKKGASQLSETPIFFHVMYAYT
jgi:hypothetical protein